MGSARQFERRIRELGLSAVKESIHDLPTRLEVPRLCIVVDEVEVHFEQDGDTSDRLSTLVGVSRLVVSVRVCLHSSCHPSCVELPRWRDAPIPKRFPKEFRDDVVRMARGDRFTHEEVAHDFNNSLLSFRHQ